MIKPYFAKNQSFAMLRNVFFRHETGSALPHCGKDAAST